MFKVVFYKDIDGDSPIDDFMNSCSIPLRNKISRQYKYLQMFGLTNANPNLKKLSGTPLWEIRILGKDNIRIICVSIVVKIVIVLHIFNKKSNKTPLKEINLSLKRYKSIDMRYLKRYHRKNMKYTYFDDFLKEQLKDPEFKEEWDKSEPAYQVGRALIKSRIEKNMSQRQLAKKANTTQAVISRIESMSVSPTLSILRKLAKALGKKIEIKFAP